MQGTLQQQVGCLVHLRKGREYTCGSGGLFFAFVPTNTGYEGASFASMGVGAEQQVGCLVAASWSSKWTVWKPWGRDGATGRGKFWKSRPNCQCRRDKARHQAQLIKFRVGWEQGRGRDGHKLAQANRSML